MTITPLLRSMCGSGMLWCLTGTRCCECLLHLAYVLAICLCVRYLCLVLAALWLYGKSGAWRAPDVGGEWPL